MLSQVISADGDPTNELQYATQLGSKSIEATTQIGKITSQLMHPRMKDLLGVNPQGNMSSLSNPQVVNGLSRINAISSQADRIWKGTWHGRPVYEYINTTEGIGVVRDRVTGELVTVLSRTDLSQLEAFVQNGTAEWLK